jgi:hypothetical protein
MSALPAKNADISSDSTGQKQAAWRLQNCLGSVIVSVGASATIRFGVVSRGVSAVPSDLQTKLEKYASKAAQYEKAAQQATEGPERAFYQGLARYCDELATNFRQVIAKRTDTSLAPE